MLLSDANTTWHEQLEQSYQGFLEALTALELPGAGRELERFMQSLHGHIAFEEQHIEPLALDWQNNTLKLIQADHLILGRLLPRLEAAFINIRESDAPRRELVRQLDLFIKMRNVLEHHDQREVEMLYPLLEKKLSIDEIQRLAESMNQARVARA